MYGDKGEVPDGEYVLPIGQAAVIQEGKDATLVSFGKMMKVAWKAVGEMKKQGIGVELIDMRTVRPLDIACVIQSVKKPTALSLLKKPGP